MKTIYLLLVTILATACNSDDPVDLASLLPPMTTTGENTFGCLIDGKFFRPRDASNVISSGNKGLRILRTEEKNLEISTFDFKSEKRTSLYIHLENFYIEGEGSYQFETANGLRGIDGPNNNFLYCILWKNNNYEVYYSFPNSGNLLISKIDTIISSRRIFSGEFKTTLINIYSTDSIRIELGRFDIETQ
jgi:hypothetical protein